MKQTILVVEDDPALRDTFKAVIKDAGFHVIVAEHGLQAIDIFQTHADEISVVITDINMPLMKGTELTDHLKNINPDIKIIFMSGFTGGLESAGNLFESRSVILQKPFRTQVLLKTIREVLTGQLTAGFR